MPQSGDTSPTSGKRLPIRIRIHSLPNQTNRGRWSKLLKELQLEEFFDVWSVTPMEGIVSEEVKCLLFQSS